jgi:exodeoxyribonuclease VII small subunit
LSSKAEAGRSFELVLQEMQLLVERLESSNLDLEEAVHIFERVTQLARECQTILDNAELRVTRIAAETAAPIADVLPTDQ